MILGLFKVGKTLNISHASPFEKAHLHRVPGIALVAKVQAPLVALTFQQPPNLTKIQQPVVQTTGRLIGGNLSLASWSRTRFEEDGDIPGKDRFSINAAVLQLGMQNRGRLRLEKQMEETRCNGRCGNLVIRRKTLYEFGYSYEVFKHISSAFYTGICQIFMWTSWRAHVKNVFKHTQSTLSSLAKIFSHRVLPARFSKAIPLLAGLALCPC